MCPGNDQRRVFQKGVNLWSREEAKPANPHHVGRQANRIPIFNKVCYSDCGFRGQERHNL